MYGWNKEFTDVWRRHSFWFVHQLLPTIMKELLFLSKHQPGDQPEGGRLQPFLLRN